MHGFGPWVITRYFRRANGWRVPEYRSTGVLGVYRSTGGVCYPVRACLLLGNLLTVSLTHPPAIPSVELLRAGIGPPPLQLWRHDYAEPRGPGLHPHDVSESRGGGAGISLIEWLEYFCIFHEREHTL